MKLPLITVASVFLAAALSLAQDTTTAPRPDEKPEVYLLKRLDEVSVRVRSSPNLTGIYTIGPDGILNMALIGATRAEGMTPRQLTDALKAKLAKYLNSPDVNVELVRIAAFEPGAQR